jgi:uncharacterized protein
MIQHSKERFALITGATSGFGFEFAKLFAEAGYNLVIVARDYEQIDKVAFRLRNEYRIDVHPLSVDLFKTNAAEEIYVAIKQKGIDIDVLVNDAGQGQYGKFIDYPLERDFDLIQLNITSLVALTKLFLKDMVGRNDGKILQVSSILGKVPTPMMSVYAATKAFVSSFTEGLINEVKDTNVTITALLPGAADTDFFHKAQGEDSKVYREQELQDPTKVARDGFDALMSGERRVISGVKNKIQAAASSILPDSALTAVMRSQMSPADKEEGREKITHSPSAEERRRIQQETGKTSGDFAGHEGHAHESSEERGRE